MRTSYYQKENQYSAARTVQLDPPTNDTGQLIQVAMQLAEMAYEPGYDYLKAKVIATELVQADEVQGSLLGGPVHDEKRARLMATLDQINSKLSADAVKYGAMGLAPTWACGQSISPDATPPIGMNCPWLLYKKAPILLAEATAWARTIALPRR